MTSGSCHDIMDHAIHNHKHRPYYTPFILHEFIKIFKDKFHFSDSLIHDFVSFIKTNFNEGGSTDSIENICRDPDDNYVLADAVINKIDVIITGDKDLLEVTQYKEIKIINPREYWNL